jgi:hypothetical protein
MFGRRQRKEVENHQESRVLAVKFMEGLQHRSTPLAVTRDALTRDAAARQTRHVLGA